MQHTGCITLEVILHLSFSLVRLLQRKDIQIELNWMPKDNCTTLCVFFLFLLLFLTKYAKYREQMKIVLVSQLFYKSAKSQKFVNYNSFPDKWCKFASILYGRFI